MAKSSIGFDSVKHASVSIHKKTHKNQESWNEIWNSKEVFNIAEKKLRGNPNDSHLIRNVGPIFGNVIISRVKIGNSLFDGGNTVDLNHV